jgi:hypothetical protein
MKISVFHFNAIEKYLVQQQRKDCVSSIVSELAVYV